MATEMLSTENGGCTFEVARMFAVRKSITKTIKNVDKYIDFKNLNAWEDFCPAGSWRARRRNGSTDQFRRGLHRTRLQGAVPNGSLAAGGTGQLGKKIPIDSGRIRSAETRSTKADSGSINAVRASRRSGCHQNQFALSEACKWTGDSGPIDIAACWNGKFLDPIFHNNLHFGCVSHAMVFTLGGHLVQSTCG